MRSNSRSSSLLARRSAAARTRARRWITGLALEVRSVWNAMKCRGGQVLGWRQQSPGNLDSPRVGPSFPQFGLNLSAKQISILRVREIHGDTRASLGWLKGPSVFGGAYWLRVCFLKLDPASFCFVSTTNCVNH
jgi:hypothetical protein